MDINTLKKQKNKDFSKISEALEKTANGGGRKADERIWKLEPDKAGNASAVIRFLPKTENDELPWVRLFSHAFKGPTGLWLFENCRTTLGEDCPVCEANRLLWETGVETNKAIVRQRKRKLSFYSNIYVVDDPNHPENNGKVFLFKFGKRIFDMIMDKAKPTFEDEEPINIFDLWDGADFKIRMTKVDGQFNYNKSTWSEKNALLDGDENKLLEVVNAQYDLAPLVAQDQFKSFEDVKVRLNRVLGPQSGSSAGAGHEPASPRQERSSPAPAETAPISGIDTSEDVDDVESWFNGLDDDA